jgi:parallel beta-helix repeat protein
MMAPCFRTGSWLAELRARWFGQPRHPRPEHRPKRPAAVPVLEPLESRLAPSGLYSRLTSPLGSGYLGTSDVVLTDVIGQLQGGGVLSSYASHILGEVQQVQGSLDHLLNDLDAQASDTTLQTDLNSPISSIKTITGELSKQGDLSVSLEKTGGTLSLSTALGDLKTALSALAGITSLSKLPPASTAFAKESGLADVSGYNGYMASPSTTTTTSAAATTATSYLYVDQNNPNATDGGPGSSAQPFKTIQAAATKATAGTTVVVYSGTYTEKVTVANSGTATAPIVFQAAAGASVTVTGQADGWYVSGKSYVTIRGFTVTKTSSYGIYVYGSSFITLDGNDVSYAGQPASGLTAKGIYISLTTDSTLIHNTVHNNTDSGIYLTNGSTRVDVNANTAFSNASQYVRQAPGIDLRSSGNTVENNVSHDNEDSGIQLYPGGGNNLMVNNVCYNNGDHGIDDLSVTGNRIIGNSVYKNVTAGINVEGGSTGATVANNISVDNGINSPRTASNIRVDSNSTSGTALDYDEIFLSVAGQVEIIWGSNFYYQGQLASFVAATGQEKHGIEADPKWVSRGTGDFRLQAGSPAIDSANSGVSGWPSTDAAGNGRVDDPNTPNTGAGPVLYADRGAYEFQPSVAGRLGFTTGPQTLTAGVTSGAITLQLQDASGNPVNAGSGGQLVSLSTTSKGGTFLDASGNPITSVTVPAGASSASFYYRDTAAGAPTLAASASGLTSASQQEAVSAAAASKLVYLTAPFALTAGSTSGTVTVQEQDQYGNATTSAETVSLSSSSASGAFQDASSGATITSVAIAAGGSTASFKYADTLAGAPTLAASASGLTSASQQETVSAAAPVANNDTATVAENSSANVLNVLANDTDLNPASTGLIVAGYSQPAHGTVTLVNGQLVYAPAAGYTGTDSFTYTASDGTAVSTPATVTLTVSAGPVSAFGGNPFTNGTASVQAAQNTPLAFNTAATVLSVSDLQATSVTVTLSVSHGTLTLDTNGIFFVGSSLTVSGSLSAINSVLSTLVYTPATGFSGQDTLTMVSDDGTLSTTDTVGITVV